MVPIDPPRIREAARLALWYLLLVGAWAIGMRSAKLGSPIEISLLGAVVPVLLGGLWIGAVGGVRVCDLVRYRVSAPGFPWETLRAELASRLREALLAGGTVGLFAFVWALFGGTSVRGVLWAHLVYLGVLVGGIGLGFALGAGLQDARTSVALGMIACAPLLTAFAWLPSIAPRSRGWLDLALNASPVTGVIVALDRRTVFWSPLLYGRLPYAEYAVTLWGPVAQAAVWGGLGALLLLVQWGWWRRRWHG